MTFLERPYRLFACLAVAAFAVAHVGSEVFVRLWIGRDGVGQAIGETLYYAATQPLGTAMLLVPFALLGWMAASLARKKALRSGMVLFAAGSAVLGLIYFWGHIVAQQAMQDRMWTAAALSVGLLPFESVPVLAVAFVARLLMGRKVAVQA